MNDATQNVDVLLTGKTLPNADIEQAVAAFAKMGNISPEQARNLITGGKSKVLWRGLSPEKGLAVTSRFASMGIEAVMRPGASAMPVPLETPRGTAAPMPDNAASVQPEPETAPAAVPEVLVQQERGAKPVFDLAAVKELVRRRRKPVYALAAVLLALGLAAVLGLSGVLHRDGSESQPPDPDFRLFKEGLYDPDFSKGYKYQYGRGVSKSGAEAAVWYRKAAERGIVAAMHQLGSMYQYGSEDLRRDSVEAVNWYRKAAELGYSGAQRALGAMYEEGMDEWGWGIPKDEAEAVAWYRRAADVGNDRAQYDLGRMYEAGRGGLPKSDVEAVAWYRKAAAKRRDDTLGYAEAQYRLGLMYEQGRGGLPKDEKKAMDWYYAAAADEHGFRGSANAMYRIGLLEERRLGSKVGACIVLAEAGKWYQKAIEKEIGRHAEADRRLVELSARCSQSRY